MATYSKKQLTDAIKEACYICNDLRSNWGTPGNDCTGKSCSLYPYRPGDGPGHADKGVSKAYHGKGYQAKSPSDAPNESISDHHGGVLRPLESHEPPESLPRVKRKYTKKSAI